MFIYVKENCMYTTNNDFHLFGRNVREIEIMIVYIVTPILIQRLLISLIVAGVQYKRTSTAVNWLNLGLSFKYVM